MQLSVGKRTEVFLRWENDLSPLRHDLKKSNGGGGVLNVSEHCTKLLVNWVVFKVLDKINVHVHKTVWNSEKNPYNGFKRAVNIYKENKGYFNMNSLNSYFI